MRRVRVLLVNVVARMAVSLAVWSGLGIGGVPVAHAQSRETTMPRWPERITHPLRVFVEKADEAPLDRTDWSADHVRAVHTAFDVWVATGIPIRLTFVSSPALADVTVRTVSRFPEGISGRTTWQRDAAGWMQRGAIVLARRAADDTPFLADEIHAVALHEVGHLLGLPHVTDPGQIMAPRIRARMLSPGDVATIRSLYFVLIE